MTFFVVLAERGKRRGVIRKMSTYTNEFLQVWLPDGGSEYLLLSGRLFVSVTRFPLGFDVISSWSSNREVRNTLNATFCIPFYTNAEVQPVNGRWVCDGSLSADTVDIPGAEGRTMFVTIDLTNTEAHVLGTGLTPFDVLFPAREERQVQIFEQGKALGLAWEPWSKAVEGGIVTDAVKGTAGYVTRTIICTAARVSRVLEMLCMDWGILHFEPLAMKETTPKAAKWTEAENHRYMRRQSMSM